MHRLSRDVRFNLVPGQPFTGGINGHGGLPATDRPAVFWTVRVTVAGGPGPSGYLLDIKAVDDAVRRLVGGVLADAVTDGRLGLPGVAGRLAGLLRDAWPTVTLERVELIASPFQSAVVTIGEPDMITLNHHFEFSASHRLHDAALSDEQNRRLFGKCNNADGHGHNYEVRVTVAGVPDANGSLVNLAELEELVEAHAIGKVDHKYLNVQVPEFREQNPSVERIAHVIYGWLKPLFADGRLGGSARLKSVTVWETPKTFCEFEEDDVRTA